MEFKFNVSEIFPGPIVEINQTLIPPGFSGDRRALWDVVTKVSEVVNAMGDASAVAQGLTKPITTSDRLRNSEQTIYLLVDKHAKGGKGVVTGMLKTGKKSLYVFDRDGHHYQVSPPCVLDFYVHESRQRTGLGKQLFEHMLQTEKVEPVKMAVDRPSEKLLSFLDKHYGLNSALRQMNNYVVFDGFFPELQVQNINGDGSNSGSPSKTKGANGLQQNFISPYGRYGAPRPPCSMGQIIHNQSPVQSNEPTGVSLPMRSKTVTQSTPAMGHPQQINSNQGHADVCQSAPNVAYQQTQQPVDPNIGQQNVQYNGESNVMTQQQESMPHQQPNMHSYSNMQHQHQQPQTHHHLSMHSSVQNQQLNMQGQQLNAQGQHLNMHSQQSNMQSLQSNTQGQQLNAQGQQINAQGQHLNMHSQPPNTHFQQLNMPQYQQHMHEHQNMQQHPQEKMLEQQKQPNKNYHNQMSPRKDERHYEEHVQHHKQVVSQPNMPLDQQHKQLPSHQLVQTISQPQFAQTAISYPDVSTQYQQIQTTQQQPRQFIQPPANQDSIPQQASETVIHKHIGTSPPSTVPHQMVSPHQTVPTQHTLHSHAHAHSEQMVFPHQTVPQQYAPHSHSHAHSEQVVSPHQHTPHSHPHAHPEQVVSLHQILPHQHTPHSYPCAHSKQMGFLHQNVPQYTTPHIHQHVHSQQMPPPQQAVPSQPSPQIVAPQEGLSAQQVTPSQPYLKIAQPQSMPTVTQLQQQLPQLQSMPILQPAQRTVQYQQYIQPPNIEQPVQMKPQHDVAPQTNITLAQNATRVPYQYYDSSVATMKTGYSQPHANAQNVHTSQIPNAAGDMSPVQKSPDYYQVQQNISEHVTPSGQVVSTSQAPVHKTQHGIVQQETVGSLHQDQSGQMSDQRMQQHGQPLNGEHQKALDDSVGQSPKLERPRSLSIQRSEESDNLDKKISNDVKSEVHSKEPKKKAEDELDNIENDVEKVEIVESVPQLNAANSSEKNSVDGSDDSENRSKSPNPLTAQGFFDLKFYHSRLW